MSEHAVDTFGAMPEDEIRVSDGAKAAAESVVGHSLTIQPKRTPCGHNWPLGFDPECNTCLAERERLNDTQHGTKATLSAIQAVEAGKCSDDDLKAVLALRSKRIEIDGHWYSLDMLSNAITVAWRYAFNRGGDEFVISDHKWKEQNGI